MEVSSTGKAAVRYSTAYINVWLIHKKKFRSCLNMFCSKSMERSAKKNAKCFHHRTTPEKNPLWNESNHWSETEM
jgi:hypothetical protein